MKKKFLPLGLVGALLTMAGCSGEPEATGSEASEQSPMVLSITEMDPQDSVNGAAWDAFTSHIEAETAGDITFETYYNSSLLPGEEALSGVGTGTADIGRIIAAYYPGELPTANWMLNLGGLATEEYPTGFVQGMMTTNDMFVQDAELKSELIDNNTYPLLANVPSQQYDMLCTEPISTLQDAKGKSTRTPGGLWSDEIEVLGMTPVTMPMGEVYEGLQRGVIDCAVVQVPAYIDFGLWEVAPHYVPVKLSQQNGNMLVINNKLWESLSDDSKRVFEEAATKFNEVFLNDTIERYRQFATVGPEDHGVVFADPADLNALVKEFQEERAESMIEDAPGSVSDPEQFVADYMDTLQNWENKASEAISAEDWEPTGDIIQDYSNAPDVNLSE